MSRDSRADSLSCTAKLVAREPAAIQILDTLMRANYSVTLELHRTRFAPVLDKNDTFEVVAAAPYPRAGVRDVSRDRPRSRDRLRSRSRSRTLDLPRGRVLPESDSDVSEEEDEDLNKDLSAAWVESERLRNHTDTTSSQLEHVCKLAAAIRRQEDRLEEERRRRAAHASMLYHRYQAQKARNKELLDLLQRIGITPISAFSHLRVAPAQGASSASAVSTHDHRVHPLSPTS